MTFLKVKVTHKGVAFDVKSTLISNIQVNYTWHIFALLYIAYYGSTNYLTDYQI